MGLFINILGAFITFLILVFGVIAKTKNDENKTNKSGLIIIFLGFLAMIFTSYSLFQDDSSKKDTTAKNEKLTVKLDESIIENRELSKDLSEATDSIINMNSKINNLTNYVDSVKISSNTISKLLKNKYEPIVTENLDFMSNEVIRIKGQLKKGMTIKILRGNCQSNLALVHNNDLIRIHNNNSGSWEVMIDQDGEIGGSYINNESKLQCSLKIEIYSNKEEKDNKISFIRTIPNPEKPNDIVCDFESFQINGSWQIVQNFISCEKNDGDIDWPQLVTYYNVTEFKKEDKEIIFKGDKIGENYKGKEQIYAKKYPLGTDKGYIKDCELIIPLNDEVYFDGDFIKNTGFFKFDQMVNINGRTVMYGEFYHSYHGCKGEVKLFN